MKDSKLTIMNKLAVIMNPIFIDMKKGKIPKINFMSELALLLHVYGIADNKDLLKLLDSYPEDKIEEAFAALIADELPDWKKIGRKTISSPMDFN